MEVRPEVLILSSRNDFSCDYVVSRLISRGVTYLRLNTEDLSGYSLCLDPARRKFTCTIDGTAFLIADESLRSVWFRRAVYLRDHTSPEASAWQQITRMQWAAFIRGLVVFQEAKWVNHPGATYLAEQKPLQLSVAASLGLQIPETLVSNDGQKITAIGTHARGGTGRIISKTG